ncbi:hypothetical protein Tco_0880504 [Tanacetum coccineum]
MWKRVNMTDKGIIEMNEWGGEVNRPKNGPVKNGSWTPDQVTDKSQKDKNKAKTSKAEHGNGMSMKKPKPKACPSSMDQPRAT